MAMLFLSPLHVNLFNEEPVKRLVRYHEIATDIKKVVNDPNEKLLFKGTHAREKTAIMLVSMAFHESGFHKGFDDGTKFGAMGEVCILQVMPNMRGTQFNYTKEYLKDRERCIRAALAIARRSNCPGGLHNRMRAYASGSCAKRSDPKAEARVAKAARGEVRGYVRFMWKYHPKRFFKFKKLKKMEGK